MVEKVILFLTSMTVVTRRFWLQRRNFKWW
jgi:hypothetical protein